VTQGLIGIEPMREYPLPITRSDALIVASAKAQM